MRRPALAVLAIGVVTLHVAALWLLAIATRPHPEVVDPVRRIAMVDVVQLPPAEAPAPAGRAEATPRAMTPRKRANSVRMPARNDAIAAPDVQPDAAAHPPMPTASAAPAAPLVLDSAAMRRALRDIGRERAVAERAHQDLRGHPPPALDSHWSASISGAAKGDCMKGRFKGSGLGLLSLPALALAAAKGDCGS